MAELLDQLRLLVEGAVEALGYAGILLVMLLENVFPPIPSELVMPFAGFLVADGKLSFAGVITAGTAGSVLGALLLYAVGWWAHEPVVRRFLRAYGRYLRISEHDLDRSLAVFTRYGMIIVLAGRLVPMVRSLVSLPAGINRMPLLPFVAYTTLGSALWNTLLGYTGYLLGENWHAVLEIIDHYQMLTLGLAAVPVIVYGLRRIRAARAPQDVRKSADRLPEAD